MKKIIDFCGSGELLSTMLADVHFCEALGSEMAGRKVTMIIFAEDEEAWPVVDEPKSTMQGNDLSVQFDEERIDIIATNGNCGEHYQPKFGPPLWKDFVNSQPEFYQDDEEAQV